MRAYGRARVGIAIAFAAMACGGLWGCLQGEGSPAPEAGAALRLALAPAALMKSGAAPASAIDSLLIRITGEGMAPIEYSRSGDSLTVILDGLPPGEDRLVSAWLFRRGRLLYAGKGLFAFRREARLDAALRCEPQFSRVISRFHLPMGLASPVRGGRLALKGPSGAYFADLEARDEFGSFLVDEVPGDARYDVTLILTDSLGKERYRADKAGVFLPLGEEAKWDLALLPVDASAGLSLGLGAPKEAVVRTGFPSSRRPLRAPGEMVIAGFYAAPAEKDSGSQGEWFSLFNRTGDTLGLAGCRLARDRGTGSTRAYPFPDAYLPPGASLSFGRPASRADILYPDFSLVNTASSLLLLCAADSVVVDSLRYSSAAADSAAALPMKEGWVTRLSAGALSLRSRPSAWCLARPDSAGPGDVRECLP